jgi:hypothetical protein
MIIESWIGKDLEGCGVGLYEVPSRRLQGVTEELMGTCNSVQDYSFRDCTGTFYSVL